MSRKTELIRIDDAWLSPRWVALAVVAGALFGGVLGWVVGMRWR